MADLSGLGDLVITVGADITPLEQSLAAIPEAAAGLTTELADSFAGLNGTLTAVDTSVAGVSEGLGVMSAATEEAAGVTTDLADSFAGLDAALSSTGEAAAAAAVGEEDLAAVSARAAAANAQATQGYLAMAPAVKASGDAAEQSAGSHLRLFTQIYLARMAFDAIRRTIEGLITPYADLQKAQLALGALLGDRTQADAAIQSAKDLANALGLAQDAVISEQQKLIALGEPLSAIPRDMTAIADGAAAMNTSFDTAAQRFDQVINSGSLMARSLTSIGINVQSVGAAMGLAGVPATTLTAIFKQLDESQRAAVISAAELAKNAGLAAAAASGVKGTWTEVANTFGSAKQAMGAFADGFPGLASAATTAIKIIEDLFFALVGDVREVGDVIAVTFGTLVPVFEGVGKVLFDAFTQNFAAIPGDVKTMVNAVSAAQNTFLVNASNDWQKTGDAISGIWTATTKSVTAATTTAATQTQSAMQMLQASVKKTETDFAAVAAAFAAGKVTANEYTAALTALNKQQEDVNNGYQNAHTALLIVENDYRIAQVAVANARTDLQATVTAVDAGAASWSMYVKALDALNKAQEEANGGLQDAGTAASLVDAALEKLAITAANAQTYFDAVVKDMAAGQANAFQYTAALNALNKAQEELNGGYQNAHTALLMAQNDYQQLQVTLANATTHLAAVYEAYQHNTAGLNQLIKATEEYVAAQENANSGLISQQSAMAAVAAEESKLNIASQNANTLLAQAHAQYESGAISLGTYESFVNKAKQAHDALSGAVKQTTQATQSLTMAHQGMTAAFGGSTAAVQAANDTLSTFATSLQLVNGQWVNLGGEMRRDLEPMSETATNLEMVNGQLVRIGTVSPSATVGVNALAGALAQVNGQLVNLGGTAAAAVGSIGSVGQAAANAASQVQTLGQQLDATMSAKIGGLTMSLTPGEQITMPTGAGWVGGGAGGTSETITWDPADFAKQLQQQIAAQNSAATATTKAATSLSTVSTSVSAMAQAIADAQAANMLEQKAQAAEGTAAYSQLKQLADAATAAAGQEIQAAQGTKTAVSALSGTVAALSTTTAALGATVTTAAQVAQGAAAATVAAAIVVSSVAKSAGLQVSGGGAMGTPIVTPSAATAVLGPGGGAGNTALMASEPWLYGLAPATPGPSIVNLNVNLAGSTVVGQQAAQNLSDTMANAMVSKLATVGVRLTRP